MNREPTLEQKRWRLDANFYTHSRLSLSLSRKIGIICISNEIRSPSILHFIRVIIHFHPILRRFKTERQFCNVIPSMLVAISDPPFISRGISLKTGGGGRERKLVYY